MLRNKTAFQLADELLGKDGYYTADSEFVEVRINGEYRGVYLLTEQQQIGKGRIDINEPEKDYTGSDIGYLLEYDGYYNNEEPLYSGGGLQIGKRGGGLSAKPVKIKGRLFKFGMA